MSVFPPFRLALGALAVLSTFSQAAEPQDIPTLVEADSVDGHAQSEVKARGNVYIVQGQDEISADWANYNAQEQHVVAGDKVTVKRNGETITGKSLDYFLDKKTGTLETATYQLPLEQGRGDAVKVLFEGDKRYQLKSARFTSCPVDNDSWYMHGERMTLDFNRNSGVVRNGWLEFQGVPILYSPWMNFPLEGDRQSGLLTPTFKVDSRNGIDFTLPLYWNIAPQYDATLYPRYMAKRGTMLGLEGRYLQPSFGGMARVDYLDDRKSGDTRYSIAFEHRQQITDRLTMTGRYQEVSDNDYFNDLGSQGEIATTDNLPRDLALQYSGDGWYGSALWQTFQTIQNAAGTVDEPYRRLPQLYFSSSPDWVKHAPVSITAEYADFQHDTKVEGQRAWVYPTITAPVEAGFGFIRPKIGVHATQYSIDRSTGTDSESRVLPIVSVDSGLVFEREDSLFGGAYTQTLEPRIYYVYIPYKDQSALPNFDSGTTDFSMAQIFTENRFSGNDRINDANDVTLAVTSRFFDDKTGAERLSATLAQRFYLEGQRVTLSGPPNTSEAAKSDVLFSLSTELVNRLQSNYTYQYNIDDGRSIRSDFGVSWRPGDYKTANLRYILNRTASPVLEQVDASFQWPIARNWYGVGRANYSLRDNEMLDALVGAEYNGGCWGLRFAAQRYVSSNNEFNTTYFVMLQLGSFGGLGSNPLSTLRTIVPGYSNPFPDSN
ncbi:LPS-assembly protein LptD [Chitinibacteraceae bacterium HSL-7]